MTSRTNVGDTARPSRPVAIVWIVPAALALAAGCASTTLNVPAGHPARADAAAATPAEPASILRPDAPLYTPTTEGEPEEMQHRHHHGAPQPEPADDAEEQHEGQGHHDHGAKSEHEAGPDDKAHEHHGAEP